jgi:DNA invertase Pin-like site-specific DNA recombinase
LELYAVQNSPRKIYVGYYRVSTVGQGQSGLGLEAQQEAVRRHVNDGVIAASFTEVESARSADRPQLALALRECRRRRAILVIAKLDRLSRNVRFIADLLDSNVEIIACDMPQANKFMLHIMSAIAQHECEMISKRTKEALAAARARGVKLGGSRSHRFTDAERHKGSAAGSSARRAKSLGLVAEIAPVIAELRAEGRTTLAALADGLNRKGITTPRGCIWKPAQVQRIIQRGA